VFDDRTPRRYTRRARGRRRSRHRWPSRPGCGATRGPVREKLEIFVHRQAGAGEAVDRVFVHRALGFFFDRADLGRRSMASQRAVPFSKTRP